jgi:hypothetical protein
MALRAHWFPRVRGAGCVVRGAIGMLQLRIAASTSELIFAWQMLYYMHMYCFRLEVFAVCCLVSMYWSGHPVLCTLHHLQACFTGNMEVSPWAGVVDEGGVQEVSSVPAPCSRRGAAAACRLLLRCSAAHVTCPAAPPADGCCCLPCRHPACILYRGAERAHGRCACTHG